MARQRPDSFFLIRERETKAQKKSPIHLSTRVNRMSPRVYRNIYSRGVCILGAANSTLNATHLMSHLPYGKKFTVGVVQHLASNMIDEST